MGALGGAILGHNGVAALQSDPGLGIGSGLEGFPDGVSAAGPVSTADLFYELSGGDPSTPDSQSVVAEGLTIHNGIPFEQIVVGQQGYTRVNRPFTDPANANKVGFWSTADEATVRPDMADFDLRWTFIWFAAADTVSQRLGVSVMDSAASADGEAPYAPVTIDDRNSNRYLPDYDSAADTVGITVFTNGNGVIALTGSELVADGVTEHTAGFSVTGTAWRFYFDGVEKTNIVLTAGERTQMDACRRIGAWWPSVVFSDDVMAFRLIEYSALGDLWTP